MKTKSTPTSIKSIKKIKTAKIIRPTTKVPSVSINLSSHMSIEEMIKLITDAIQFKFKGDKTAPGLTIARLKNGEMYVSVVRFNAPFGKDKRVEYKARNHDLIASLYDIARQITNQDVETNPIDQLTRYISVGSVSVKRPST